MFEEWVTLLDFPMYQINNMGDIVNQQTGKQLSKSITKQNIVKVSLINNQGRFTRSVALLVASIFVAGRNDIFNTPIHLDGDLFNCEASNLMWRPRWFAYQYHRQFTHNRDICIELFGQAGPLIESLTNTFYFNVYEACITNGLLMEEVNYKSGLTNPLEKKVWPTNQIFDFGSRQNTSLFSK